MVTIDEKINSLLDHCWRHGDQRSFKDLLSTINASVEWARSNIDLRPASAMDEPTIQSQWYIVTGILCSSAALSAISRLRLGELFDRLSALARESILTHTDDHGHPQHYTSAMEYLRSVFFKYEKRDERGIHACHQFFLVWKEFHPIIAYSTLDMSWSGLREALTKDKLLIAARAFKDEHPREQPVVLRVRELHLPALLRAVPPPTLGGPATLLLDSWYQPAFITDPNAITARLESEVQFIDRKAFYGDVEADGSFPVYRYGADDAFPTVLPWTPVMLELRDLLTAHTGQKCNHVVVNRFNNGEDHIGYHHDKTLDFADGTHVITISLGATREFRIQDKDGLTVASAHLEHGSLNVLGWDTNTEHKHSIVKTSAAVVSTVHYGLTFRTMKTNSNQFLRRA